MRQRVKVPEQNSLTISGKDSSEDCHLCKNIGLLKGYCGMQVALSDEEEWYFNEENAECIQTSPGII